MTKLEPTRTSSDLTATERLRRLLDERGVEWAEYGDGYTLLRHGGREYTVQPNVCNRLIVTNLTPEQAIAATIGSCNCTNGCTNGERTGTCQITPQFTCSECGHQYQTRNYECYETCDGRTAYASLGYDVLDCEKPNYCPNCGRKVVDA